MRKNILERVVAVIIALILLQTLFFKFTAAPESVAIFTKLGAEPWGRIMTGVFELIAGVGLLIPKFARKAAVLAGLLMIGAIMSHLTVLGVSGPNAPLFTMALIVLVGSVFVFKVRKK